MSSPEFLASSIPRSFHFGSRSSSIASMMLSYCFFSAMLELQIVKDVSQECCGLVIRCCWNGLALVHFIAHEFQKLAALYLPEIFGGRAFVNVACHAVHHVAVNLKLHVAGNFHVRGEVILFEDGLVGLFARRYAVCCLRIDFICHVVPLSVLTHQVRGGLDCRTSGFYNTNVLEANA